MTTPATTSAAEAPLPEWQKSIPTIHSLNHSQAQRVIWALQEIHKHNGLKFHCKNYEREVPFNKELAKLSPMGKSPILTVVDLEGKPLPGIQLVDGVVMESSLVLQFLSETYGGKELWEQETDAEKRRDVYFRAFATQSLQDRIDQPLVVELIPELLPFGLKHLLKLIFSPLVNALHNFQHKHYEHMSASLTDEMPWFAGKKMGIADFCMEFPVSVAFGRGMCDPVKYPKIKAWHDKITQREAWKEAIELGGGPDAYELEFFGMKSQKFKL